MFIDVTVFGRSAEVANQYLAKGRKVLVEGRLVLDQWVDNQGNKRSKHSVVAEKLQFMDSKSSGDNNYGAGGYAQQSAAPQYQQPQPQQPRETQNDIPSIDIDEDNIPF
jgi:single-strand DNA-binding protein